MGTKRQLDKPITYSPLHLAILVCFVAIVSYLAAKLGAMVVIPSQVDWTLWPGNILLACVLLFVSRKIWPIVVAAALLTFAVYDLRIGLSLRTVFFFQLSDAVETLTAALGLSYAFGGPPKLNSVKALAKYAFFAVILAPFAGAFLGALTTHGEYRTGWWIAFLSQALGYLTLMPAVRLGQQPVRLAARSASSLSRGPRSVCWSHHLWLFQFGRSFLHRPCHFDHRAVLALGGFAFRNYWRQ